jgi:hypothetical protein
MLAGRCFWTTGNTTHSFDIKQKKNVPLLYSKLSSKKLSLGPDSSEDRICPVARPAENALPDVSLIFCLLMGGLMLRQGFR